MKVSTIVMDFEKGLCNAAKANFPDAVELGCFFHWKQAMNKCLTELGIPKNMIADFLGENGPLNLLTVIPIPDIIPKGTETKNLGPNKDLTRFSRSNGTS